LTGREETSATAASVDTAAGAAGAAEEPAGTGADAAFTAFLAAGLAAAAAGVVEGADCATAGAGVEVLAALTIISYYTILMRFFFKLFNATYIILKDRHSTFPKGFQKIEKNRKKINK
jgi:hypothetical protein